MSDRRPSTKCGDCGADFTDLGATELADHELDHAVAVVRRGVESGTIKGEVVEVSRMEADASGRVLLVTDQAGTFIVVGPVSDGGSET